jgi:hypothetical protein
MLADLYAHGDVVKVRAQRGESGRGTGGPGRGARPEELPATRPQHVWTGVRVRPRLPGLRHLEDRRFPDRAELFTILKDTVDLVIISFGLTVVLLTGEFDLSLAGVISQRVPVRRRDRQPGASYARQHGGDADGGRPDRARQRGP